MDENLIQDIIEINKGLIDRLKREFKDNDKNPEQLKVAGELAIQLLECTIAYLVKTHNDQDMKSLIKGVIRGEKDSQS